MRYFLLFIPFLLFTSCKGQSDTPKALEIAFDFIERKWNKKDIESFKTTEEEEATLKQHRGMGLTIRNKLLRNGKHSDLMLEFFAGYGTFHLDDMSSMILTSYHRYLNGKALKLQEQLDYYIAYWKPIIECDKKMDTLAMETFKNHKIGDTIVIELPVSESNSVVDYQCKLDWVFNDSIDLLITGIVTEKRYDELPNQLRFEFRVLTKNHPETKILWEEVNLGDLMQLKLKTSWRIRS